MAGDTIIIGNWNDMTPSAPAGADNVQFQKDASSPPNISAYIPRATTSQYGTVKLDAPQELSVEDNATIIDCSLGKYFELATGGANVEISAVNGIDGTAYLVAITGAGTISLGSKFILRSANMARSAGIDYLLFIYNFGTDRYQALWNKGA